MDQVEAAAYHEAGHVVALRHEGQRAQRVCVDDDGSGSTIPNDLPQSAEAVALVALVGIQAESQRRGTEMNVDDFFQAYASAASDRDLIAESFKTVWLGKGSLWHQAQYDRAHKFVSDHENDIATLAHAILNKPGFPKCLDETEIDALIGN